MGRGVLWPLMNFKWIPDSYDAPRHIRCLYFNAFLLDGICNFYASFWKIIGLLLVDILGYWVLPYIKALVYSCIIGCILLFQAMIAMRSSIGLDPIQYINYAIHFSETILETIDVNVTIIQVFNWEAEKVASICPSSHPCVFIVHAISMHICYSNLNP